MNFHPEPEVAPIPIDDARFKLLVRLISAIRNNAVVAPLPDAQMANAVEDWHETLSEVPTNQLTFLRLRGVQRGLKTASEFVSLWRSTLERRRDAEAADELRRETEAQREAERLMRGDYEAGKPESSARRTFRLQGERLRRGAPVIACHCQSENGFPLDATLNGTGEFWRCKNHQCAFRVPLEHTDLP